ncbi:MAG: prenyltransferase/squalene oxidase repeat-containing protein [Nitrospirales bacterium]
MNSLAPTLNTIQGYQLPNGGFPYQAGEKTRPDATAWAVIAMAAFKTGSEQCEQARKYLISLQAEDGHISISPEHDQASWPTPLALLAWSHSPQDREAHDLAVNFLLRFSGLHFEKTADSVMGHNTAIVGWPWIANTHSWVIPTSMAITALQISGIPQHARIAQGVSMLVDRQLPHGGWNSGNTLVFGKELLPLPECTGIALQALAGNTERHTIQKSLDYLLHELPRMRTPISLGWTLLGLSAWGLKPAHTEELISASLRLQDRHGPYSVPSLAILLCAAIAPQGLHSIFSPHVS